MTREKYKLFIVLILAAVLGFIWLGREDIRPNQYRYDKVSLLTRFAAKEYCSCRFVTERSPEECRRFIDVWLPVFHLKLHTNWFTLVSEENSSDGKAAHVAAKSFWGLVRARANYKDGHGCLLEP